MWNGLKQDLIETTLDTKTRTPVYTQKTVEQVAEIVKKLMDSGYNGGKIDENGNATNEVYKQLYKQITGQEFGSKNSNEILPIQATFEEAVRTPNSIQLSYSQMGWTLKDNQGNDTDEKSEAWSLKDEDHLRSSEINATAILDFGELSAGDYTLQYYALQGMDAQLVYGDNDTVITKLQNVTSKYWGNEYVSFNLPQTSKLKLKLKVVEENAEICNGILAKADGTKLRDNFTKYELQMEDKTIATLTNFNIKGGENTRWTVGPYGITSGDNYYSDAGEIYIEQDVKAGVNYQLKCANERCKILVLDTNNTQLAELRVKEDANGKLVSETEVNFIVPEGVDKIRIKISQDENASQESGYRGVREMYLISLPVANLGTYNATIEKFGDKNSKKGLDSSKKLTDVNTCMDYAYYVLNTFWLSTGDDITQKTNNYKSITLNKDGDYYKIDQDNLVYDLENNTIYKDAKAPKGAGYFPLDNSVLGDKNDLNDKFKNDGEILDESENPVKHNYHFATKAHTQFVYKQGMSFHFTGDDDVYVFIDGKKVIDLGGAHGSLEGVVNLDDLNLTEGEVYDLDFFHLERHSSASNFAITTNITFEEPKTTTKVEFYKGNNIPVTNETRANIGDEIGIKYIITAGNKGTNSKPEMFDLSFNDSELGITINEDGINLSNDVYVKENEGITFKITGKEDVNISYADLKDPNKQDEIKEKISQLSVGKEGIISVEGLYKKVTDQLFKSKVTGSLKVKMNEYNDKTGNFEETTKQASSSSTLTFAPNNTPIAILDVKFVDNVEKEFNDQNQDKAYDTQREGTNINLVYTLTANSDYMKGIAIEDENGFSISKDGINIPVGFNGNNLTVSLFRQGQENAEIVLSGNILSDKISTVFGTSNDAWVLNKDDKIVIKGLNKKLDKDTTSVTSNVTAEFYGPTFNYNEETATWEKTYISAEDLQDIASISKSDTYTVIYEVDNPSVANIDTREIKDKQRVQKNETSSQPPVEITNPHYEKIGWKKIVNGQETTLDKNIQPSQVEITADTTFTAITQAKKYPCQIKFVYLDSEGHEEKAVTDKDVESQSYGSEWKITPSNIEGYDLLDGTYSITVRGTTVEENTITVTYKKKKLNIKFKTDGNGSLEGNTDTPVEYSQLPKFPTPIANDGYEFTGWTIEGKNEIVNPSKYLITQDTIFVAHYTPIQYTYQVKYVDTDGNGIAPTENRDKTYTIGQTTDKEIAKDITGYKLVSEKEQTLKINSDKTKNVIVFVYDKKDYEVKFITDGNGSIEGKDTYTVKYKENVSDVPTATPNKGYSRMEGWATTIDGKEVIVTNPKDIEITGNMVFKARFAKNIYPYTVEYVDDKGNKLYESKTGINGLYGGKIEEAAIVIEGYTPDENKKSITIDTENNVIRFVYSKKSYDVKFVTDGNGTLTGKEEQKVNYKEKVSENNVPQINESTGYTFKYWTTIINGKEEIVNPSEIEVVGTTVFTAHFEANQYEYTVKYVDTNGREIAESVTKEEVYGKEVKEVPKEIEGYVAKDSDKTITINTENNEIIFVYTKVCNVLFTTDENGTLGENTQQIVEFGKTITTVPEYTAKEGYTFVGWTTTVDGKEVEVDDLSKVTILKDTVFTAHFEAKKYDYTVKYVDENGKEIAESITKEGIYGQEVTETPKEIEGYVTKDSDKTITITTLGNVIIFEYNKVKTDKPEEPTLPSITDLVIYKVDQDGKFLTGAAFKLVKVEDNKEKVIDTQSTGSKFEFKDLTDGKYRIYETVVPKGYKGIDGYFEIEIVDGKIYYEEKLIEVLTVYNTNDGNNSYVQGDEIDKDNHKEEVQDQEVNDKVKTSDEQNIIGYAGMSVLAIAIMYLLKKKRLIKH